MPFLLGWALGFFTLSRSVISLTLWWGSWQSVQKRFPSGIGWRLIELVVNVWSAQSMSSASMFGPREPAALSLEFVFPWH